MGNVGTNNLIKLKGTVVTAPGFSHEAYGESFYAFKLEVERLSDTVDTLNVMLSNRETDPRTLTVGDVVSVEGQIRSYGTIDPKDGRNHSSIYVFLLSLSTENDTQGGKKLNDGHLDGFICKPPVYRTTPFGREIADLRLVVNRSRSKTKSDYVQCVAWGRNARFAEKLAVGARVKVWGRLQSRDYSKLLEDGSTVNRTTFEFSISRLELSE